MRGNQGTYRSGSASLNLTAHKTGTALHDSGVVLKFNFDHRLNVAFFLETIHVDNTDFRSVCDEALTLPEQPRRNEMKEYTTE